MNDHYARILHEDRMAELRREASGFRQRHPDHELTGLVASLFGKVRGLSVRFTSRRSGPGNGETQHVRERRMPPAKSSIGS